MKAAVDTVAELKALNVEIGGKVGRQQAPTTGAAEQKAQVREDYEAKILEVGDQLSSIAAATENANLGAQVEFSKAGLGKLSDDELQITGERTAALARANVAALADYNVTAAEITELERLTTAFNGIKNAPRATIAGKSSFSQRQLPTVRHGAAGLT